jgi:hypothetical protein
MLSSSEKNEEPILFGTKAREKMRERKTKMKRL